MMQVSEKTAGIWSAAMTNGLHVLIIEDEMLVGMDMVHHLSDIGFATFAFAGTAAQAMEQARLKRPDLVTVDVGLLDGDGRAAAGALKREHGALAVIYVTGDPEALADTPGAVIVEKPFGRHDLEAACRRLDLH
jgi:DNA-binding response OmpR family regulator